MTGPARNQPVAVVTGGTRGIGLAIATRLAGMGHHVVAAARRPPAAPLPADAAFAACDVADPAAVRALFETVAATHGRVDVLVNNAGVAGSDRLDDPGEEMWRRIMATNLDGAYRCAKAAIPLMPDGTGRIVNVSSVLGLKGVPDQPAYVAAKHGLIGLTRALAHALAPRRITVNAVCPGWVDTEMAAGRLAELGLTAADAAAGTPTGRFTTPEEIAAAVAYLAGPEAGNLTGQALVIDGGWLA
ncbi:MAG TPA: SDR family oxidoreductase [Azospirillaceae bacterium]|nr:SDR family oxidoreductase [Azospirillaceae bacterium]